MKCKPIVFLCMLIATVYVAGCGSDSIPPPAPTATSPGAGNIVDTSDSVALAYSGTGDFFRISLYSGLSCQQLVSTKQTAETAYTWTGLSEGERYSWTVSSYMNLVAWSESSACRSFATKNVSFQLPEMTDYTVNPTTQAAGSDITMNFTIDNTGPARTLYLGATIVLDGTFSSANPNWIDDAAHDGTTCELAAGETGKTCSRVFSIPTGTPAGSYEVLWGLWWGYPGEGIKYGLARRAGYLTVTN